MGVFDDMNKLLKMKAAMAMEKASDTEGAAGAGMGAGFGLMLPAMFAQYLSGQKSEPVRSDCNDSGICAECESRIPVNAKFCPLCGHQQVIFEKCTNCGKNLTPNAKFCSRCGHPAGEKPKSKLCSHCGSENLVNSIYCNKCGEKHSSSD
jgi:membrane protease subunit (stomatin/prohibitin family)